MKKNKSNIDNSAFKPLSDELGIEPPKIYNQEQRQRINAEYYSKKEATGDNKTKSTKREQNKPKQKRKLKSKYRKILYGLITALSIIGVLIILSLTVLFKIESITVEGNNKYDSEQIIKNTPISLQTNLFLADTKNAEQMLETNLPYIYNVKIKRKIPSKIIISITEADTFYTAKLNDNSFILMDNNFKVLEIGLEQQPENTLLIDSIAVDSANIGQILGFSDESIKQGIVNVNEIVKKLKIAEITSIYAVDSNNYYAVFDNRLVIKLGKAENIENKLYAALATIDKLQETNQNIEGEVNVANGKDYYFTEKH